jgi:hypothetical protein
VTGLFSTVKDLKRPRSSFGPRSPISTASDRVTSVPGLEQDQQIWTTTIVWAICFLQETTLMTPMIDSTNRFDESSWAAAGLRSFLQRASAASQEASDANDRERRERTQPHALPLTQSFSPRPATEGRRWPPAGRRDQLVAETASRPRTSVSGNEPPSRSRVIPFPATDGRFPNCEDPPGDAVSASQLILQPQLREPASVGDHGIAIEVRGNHDPGRAGGVG